MSPKDGGAKEIAKHLLEVTGLSLLGDDFDTFCSCFKLPQEIVTDLGVRLLTTRQDIRGIFDRVRWHYRAHGITEIKRECVAAAFLEADRILTVHETLMFRGYELVQEPFVTMSDLTRDGEVWRISYTNYAIHDSLRHNRALVGPDMSGAPV